MKRISLLTAATVLAALPAFADVTITATVTGKGIGKLAEAQSVTYIKGLRMRSDSTLGDKPMSTIIDVENQKFISIDHKKKEAQVFEMAQFRETVDKAMKGGEVVGSLKPNGQTKTIAGQNCTGYDVAIEMPMAVGAEGSMKMVMTGPVFMAQGAPGSADFKAFYLAAAERGFIMSDPRAARGAPQQTKGMTELYKSMAETGGIPYEMTMSMKIEGAGPMAGMMNKMIGNSAFGQTVTAVATGAVSADKFDLPAGYKVTAAK